MRTITAPGVEIKEIDKSGYSPAMTGTACYIMGFSDKGEAYRPMEFTSVPAFVSYYGDPDNEAERYFYAAANEVLNHNGRLYCARLPYDNEAFEKMVGYKYQLTTKKQLSSSSFEYQYPELTAVDKTISEVALIEGSDSPIVYDLTAIDEYRTGENMVPANTMLIVDKTCATYKKITEDSRKGINREIVGILPVITTAANALLAQSMINVAAENINQYETIGYGKTLQTVTYSNDGIQGSKLNTDLVTQLNTKYKDFKVISVTEDSASIETIGGFLTCIEDIIAKNPNDKTTLVSSLSVLDDVLSTVNELTETLIEKFEDKDVYKNFIPELSTCYIDDDNIKVSEVAQKLEKLYGYYNLTAILTASDGDTSVPDTVSQQANSYFLPIDFNTDLQIFERNNLKKIGVVVFKAYIDAGNGNKIAFEPVESFVGSLNKNDKDPNTGTTTFIDTIINTQSNYINFFSNCWNTSADKKAYEDLDIYIAKPCGNVGNLGFYSEQTVEKISIDKSILDGINKCFEKVADINERNIDIVCDAGIANIASYLKAVWGGYGPYDMDATDEQGLPLIAKWKADKNNDAVKTWKAVVQKLDNFCKNVRKDCMFITECPRPMVLQGQQKIIRPSKPSNNIDVNILPYIMYVTGLNTSYGAGYMDWFQVIDDYSGDFFWLPPSIKAMGCYINTDVNFNYWDAPAGLTRGLVQALDVAFSPNAKQAGAIYEKNWNYSINYPQDGIVLEGQKTFQVKPSAFDRVNVRRLFLRLERAAYQVARYFVYEGNTAYTRQRLVDALDPYFKEAKIGGGIYDYKIKCDEGNNDPVTIDRNELKVSIGIKPVKTAEFILIDFIALSTGGSFEEVGL